MAVPLHHVLQPAPLVDDLDEAMDYLHALFGMYPSERVRITPAGVDNAVYALDGSTFLELIYPYDPDAAASRLLAKQGPGWHMTSFDVDPSSTSRVDAGLEAAGIRVVQHNTPATAEAWHLHPKDAGGVLVLLAAREDLEENALWAGRTWREYVGTNTRVVRRIAGVSWIADDLDALAGMLEGAFALEFGEAMDDGDSASRTATLPTGTFIQARAPSTPEGVASAHLSRQGPGLYHLAFELADRRGFERRAEGLGIDLTERDDSLWMSPRSPVEIPIQLLST